MPVKSTVKTSISAILFSLFLIPGASLAAEQQLPAANDAADEQGITPLGWSIIQYKTDQALDQIKAGADVRSYQSVASIKKIVTPHVQTTYVGKPEPFAFPLVILAAASGQDAVVKAIHARDERAVFLKDYHQNDALMWAAREGRVSTTRLLLSYGLDPLYRSEKSRTSAYQLAMEKEAYPVLDLIITHLISRQQTAPLSETIWFLSGTDQTQLLRKYLQLGIKDTYKAIKPRTALMKAAEAGKIENFKLLVQFGSDPYESNTGPFDHDYDPLTYALFNEVFLTYLLENFDYNLKKVFEGQSYLHLAYNRRNRMGKQPFLLLLAKSGLDINSVDRNQRSLLDKAVESADIEYARFFLSLGMSAPIVNKALQITQDAIQSHEQAYSRAKRKHDLEKIALLRKIQLLLQGTSSRGDN